MIFPVFHLRRRFFMGVRGSRSAFFLFTNFFFCGIPLSRGFYFCYWSRVGSLVITPREPLVPVCHLPLLVFFAIFLWTFQHSTLFVFFFGDPGSLSFFFSSTLVFLRSLFWFYPKAPKGACFFGILSTFSAVPYIYNSDSPPRLFVSGSPPPLSYNGRAAIPPVFFISHHFLCPQQL